MNGRWFTCLLVFSLIACKEEKPKEQQKPSEDAVTQQLQQQILTYPDSAGLRLRLVDAYDSLGNYKNAFLHLDTLIMKDTANYGLWYRLGTLSQNAKDTTLALRSFTRAATLYPSPDVLLSLANIYAEKKDARALQLVNEVQKMGFGRDMDANCYFIAGVYHARKGNDELAVELFDKCIASSYTYMEAHIEKGLVYFDNGDHKKALEIFRFASGVNNLYADAYYYMARCYEMMNMKDSAILRFKQSLTLDKNLTEAQNGLKRLGAE